MRYEVEPGIVINVSGNTVILAVDGVVVNVTRPSLTQGKTVKRSAGYREPDLETQKEEASRIAALADEKLRYEADRRAREELIVCAAKERALIEKANKMEAQLKAVTIRNAEAKAAALSDHLKREDLLRAIEAHQKATSPLVPAAIEDDAVPARRMKSRFTTELGETE